LHRSIEIVAALVCAGCDVGLLKLEGVRKSYWRGPHEVVVLDGIDFEVNTGEFVAIWGSRGAGKSTLARIAVGLEAPDAGTVNFGGQNLAAASRAEYARLLLDEIGWVQRVGPREDELRMLDYVAMPLFGGRGPRRARQHAARVLARVGLRGCERKRWEDLTDGERTLVAIAHALAREPRLLVVDDPTANLDMLECRAVMGLLRAAVEQDGLGILVTVPEMSDMLAAHRMASLSGGRLLVPREPSEDCGADVIDFPGRQQSA
jgi:ABC-type lipoprotein export system ATPase subunit